MIAAMHGIIASAQSGLAQRTKYTLITDAVDDYATVANSAGNNISGDISIFLRIAFTQTINRAVLEKSNNNSHYHVQTGAVNPALSGQLMFGTRTGSGNRIATPTINDGLFHDVMFWQSGGVIGGYCDTTTLSSLVVAGAVTPNTQDWSFGARPGNTGYGGQMEALVYNRVLSQAEFDVLRAGGEITSGLVLTLNGASTFNGASIVTS